MIPTQGGFLLENTFLYNADEHNPAYINLSTTVGEPMQYNKNDTTFINFPGEYDVNGCFIRAIVEKDMLHYMIQMQDKKIAILGNKRAVQHDSMDIADIWYVTDASIQETMEKMEMEGDIILMEMI